MADSTITGLTAGTALAGTEVLAVDQGGVTVKTTTQEIADLVPAGGMTLLQTVTASAASGVILTSVAGFTNFRVVLTDVYCSTAGASCYMHINAGGVYSGVMQMSTGRTVTSLTTAGTLASEISNTVDGLVIPNIGASASQTLNGFFELPTLRTASNNHSWYGTIINRYATKKYDFGTYTGSSSATWADAVQFTCYGATLTGTFQLYGY